MSRTHGAAPDVPAPEPDASGFSARNALLCARAARLMYDLAAQSARGSARFREGIEHLGFAADLTRDFHDPETDTEAALLVHRDVALLLFCGLELTSEKDWKTSSRFDLSPFSRADPTWGNVHHGFRRAANATWRPVWEALQQGAQAGRPLFVAGHSLGGAVAVLAAARLAAAAFPLEALYTFGQPRVGDEPFCSRADYHLAHRWFRVMNGHDLVARLPPRALGYHHGGRLAWFDADGGLSLDGAPWRRLLAEVPYATPSPVARFRELLGIYPDALDDHAIVAYIARLAAL